MLLTETASQVRIWRKLFSCEHVAKLFSTWDSCSKVDDIAGVTQTQSQSENQYIFTCQDTIKSPFNCKIRV